MDKQEEGLKLLKDIKYINRMIEQLQDQINEVYAMLTSTTVKPKEVNVQSSGSSDPMADKMVKVIEYQEKIQEYQLQLIEKKTIALETIKKMAIEKQQIITLKYFNEHSVEEIGEIIGYTYRWAWEKIHEAEEEFIELYEQDYIELHKDIC